MSVFFKTSVFAVYNVVCCKQNCLHDNIRLENKACFVFFSALTLFFLHFCILFKISRLYSFKKKKKMILKILFL